MSDWVLIGYGELSQSDHIVAIQNISGIICTRKGTKRW